MNFEELQKSWKEQPLSVPVQAPGEQQAMLQQWRRLQRRVLWSNIATTAGFIGVLCVLFTLYRRFHNERGLLFSGSLAAMALLLLLFLYVIWKGTVIKKMDLSLPGNEYLARYIAALRWRRRTITHYTWLYMALLWLALMLYMLDVLAGASIPMQLGGPLATTAYMAFIKLIVRKKQRKQVAEIDELISGLNKMWEERE